MVTTLTNASEVAKPETGDDEDLWGPFVIACLDYFDRAFGGRANIDVTSADVTLSTSEGQSGQITAFGTPVADRNLVFPSRNRNYFVRNGTGRTLGLYVTGFASAKLYVPNGTAMLVTTNTSGETRAGSAPVHSSGGHPNSITHQGKSYVGPGLFFEDNLVGFARAAAGIMSVFLVTGGASLRFHGANTAAAPLVGMGGDFDSGFYELGSAVAWCRNAVYQGTFGQGIQVGSPTSGEMGVGTINAQNAYYRNAVALPFQTKYAQTGLSAASAAGSAYTHSLAATPDVIGRLRATVANNGYAIGDTIPAPAECGLGANATQVWYRIAAAGIPILNKSTGAAATLTAAQWTLDFTAYA